MVNLMLYVKDGVQCRLGGGREREWESEREKKNTKVSLVPAAFKTT